MYKNMNSILFDPGGSKISIGCCPGTKLKAKSFGYKRHVEPRISITEPKYNSKVLEGNWYEERINYDPCTEKNCENEKKTLIHNNDGDKIRKFTTFEAAKKIKKKNYGLGPGLIMQLNDNEYFNNYATSYDLMYRVIPQQLDGPRIRTYNGKLNKWLPEQDYTKNFGNLTGYGMNECIKMLQEGMIYESKTKPRTHYQCDYTKKEIPKDIPRFHRKRVDINRPNWSNLELDSNLSSYYRQMFDPKIKQLDMAQRVAAGTY